MWKYRQDVCVWLDDWNGRTDWRRFVGFSCWVPVMSKANKDNDREIELCGKLLKLDERNCMCSKLVGARDER